MLTKEEAKKSIQKLIEKYLRIVDSGEIKKFNEANTKNEFIEPFFKALGWDMRNEKNKDEVTMEENISKNRVDYAFKIGNIPRFFLEAKKLSEDMDNTAHARQAINYAYHRGVVWAILTNFKTLKIFNAEWKTQNVHQNQFLSLDFDQYLENFDKIWWVSKESMENRVLDKEAELVGKKAKKVSIGEQLLNDFMVWRNVLSKNILKKNQGKNLTQEDIDEVVQRLVDRFIFIRNCEDREIEEKKLISGARDWYDDEKGTLIDRLRIVFRYFDQQYDSELFQEHLCDKLEIENRVLWDIINGLYNTTDNLIMYDFSAIDADILGNIYEQYLANILKKTEKRAKVETKVAHRKEQGIYYTPTYIVEYIAKHAINALIEEGKVEIENIKIIDPACGSGSFLIKAHDILKKNLLEKSKSASLIESLFKTTRILENNIFGVDLDPKAVQITQLNLLLKAAEKRHKLPLLRKNIKCGNSLIHDNEIADEKAFIWKNEFMEIMSKGGFDIVIGNPPYVRNRDLKEREKTYFNEKFVTSQGQYDLYQLFFEKAIEIVKNFGIIGLITSNKYAIADYGKKLRKFILDHCNIKEIIDVSNIRVFREASTYPYIIILEKCNEENIRNDNKIRVLKINNEEELVDAKKYEFVKQSDFLKNPNYSFNISLGSKDKQIIEKINKDGVSLGEIVTIKETVHTGNIRKKLLVEEKIDNNCKKILRGKDCQKYFFEWKNFWLRNDSSIIDKSKGEYATIPNRKFFEHPKLFVREIAKEITACYDDKNFYSLNKAYVINSKSSDFDLKYILGLLNSKLLSWFFRMKFSSTHVRGGYLQFKKQYLETVPIKKSSKDDQEKIIKLVNEIIKLKEEWLEHQDKFIDKRIEVEDKIKRKELEINEEVFKLYGMNEDERKIIEGQKL